MIRVAVTGVGLVSSLGSTVTTAWKNLCGGQTWTGPVPDFPAQHRNPAFALAAAQQAIQDGGLTPPLPNVGVIFGTSRGQLGDLERMRRTQDFSAWAESQASAGALGIARYLESGALMGVPALACSSGAWAVGWGSRLIRWGYCDQVVCGASEAPLTDLGWAGFAQMGLQSPLKLKPFARPAQGLILGEGGAALLLERLDLAQERGARIYGEVVGCGHTNDAWHLCTPEPSQTQAVRAVALCLQEMDLKNVVDYVNAHGTGTALNDQGECALIHQAYRSGVPVGATKGATGHCLGATGAMEAIFCLLALYHQYLPPSPGLEPGYDLNFVQKGGPAVLRHVVSHSFGFGGQNVVLGFRRYDH